jgi:hypothetical protein
MAIAAVLAALLVTVVLLFLMARLSARAPRAVTTETQEDQAEADAPTEEIAKEAPKPDPDTKPGPPPAGDQESKAVRPTRPMRRPPPAEASPSRDGEAPGPEARPTKDDVPETAPALPVFPWPPPRASSWITLPSELLHRPGRHDSLKDVGNRLERAFRQAGYGELSYYRVPKGFALVTRLEQFQTDGSPLDGPSRWSVSVMAPRVFSLESYLKALFSANPGHFRIVVFIVTSEPVTMDDTTEVARDIALKWVSEGANKLLKDYEKIPFDDDVDCTALIYEFEQATRDERALLKAPGLPALTHLEKANLIHGLEE